MKANETFSDFFEFCWIILNFMTLEFKALSMSDWMSQSESKDLCIILHFFRFIQMFPEVFRYIQIYSDIFGYFAIFPHILRFIEILLDLSGYIYLCWHKTRAKGNFVQWITLYSRDFTLGQAHMKWKNAGTSGWLVASPKTKVWDSAFAIPAGAIPASHMGSSICPPRQSPHLPAVSHTEGGFAVYV